MKINTIQPTVQTKQPIIKRIKNALVKPFTNLKELVCDVFEYQKPKYVIVNGKKVKTGCSWLSPRELPNCVSGPSDWAGVTWGKVLYYPEDLEKMKNMNIDERLAYKRKLIEERRFKLEEPPKSSNF